MTWFDLFTLVAALFIAVGVLTITIHVFFTLREGERLAKEIRRRYKMPPKVAPHRLIKIEEVDVDPGVQR